MQIQAELIGEPIARIRYPVSRVIARFDSTIQLESDAGQLWAITTQPNPGPFRVVVSSIPPFAPGIPARFADDRLVLDGTSIIWDSTPIWNPRPKKRSLNSGQRQFAARKLARQISMHEFDAVLGFWDFLSGLWNPLAEALRREDVAVAQSLIARLIGRGPGLTPAGDDFVGAMLVTLHSGDDADRRAFRIVERAVALLLPKTTRLSQAFLREAMQGWAFGALKDVLDTLPATHHLDDDPSNCSAKTSDCGARLAANESRDRDDALVTQDKMNSLLSVGATSGVAYALGILFALDWNFSVEKGKSLCH